MWIKEIVTETNGWNWVIVWEKDCGMEKEMLQDSGPSTYYLWDRRKLFNLSRPRYIHLYNEENAISFLMSKQIYSSQLLMSKRRPEEIFWSSKT